MSDKEQLREGIMRPSVGETMSVEYISENKSSACLRPEKVLELKLFCIHHKFDEKIFFLSALRILCSKYHFEPEAFSLKVQFENKKAIFDFKAIENMPISFVELYRDTYKEFILQNSLNNYNLDVHEEPSNLMYSLIKRQTNYEELTCTLNIRESIGITFLCPEDSYYQCIVNRSAGHLQNLINQIFTSPERNIYDLNFIGEEENDIIDSWSRGQYDDTLNGNYCLHQIFENTVQHYPDNLAVICGETVLSYEQLNEQANKLAWYLQSLGVKRGDFCGILLYRSFEMYIAMLAIMKAGATYLPFDPTVPAGRLEFILDDSKARILVTTSDFNERDASCSCIKVLLDKDKQQIENNLSANLPVSENSAKPSDIAYTIYTSGTTGVPKGVKIPHSSACNLVKAEGKAFRVSPSDRVFQGFSISFDASIEEIWLAFNSGASLFVGTEEIMQSVSQLSTILNENNVTVLSTVPTLLSMITEDIPSVRLLILGGETCQDTLVQKWAKPGRRMVNTYGPTESTVIATFADCKRNQKVTIGKSVSNYCTYILDSKMQKVPVGVAGELHIGGLSLAEGYINQPELTAQKFITPPFPVNSNFPPRLYKSGDLARYNESGQIEFLGRIDSQVKLRGFRIELSEIEAQLLKNGHIKNAAVAVKKGYNDVELLVAYVVKKEGEKFDPLDAKKALRAKLAPYMIPSFFEVLDVLPMLPSGKVDRKNLPEPKIVVEDIPASVFGDQTKTENRILKVWQKIFAPNQVNLDDNFFDLGGHSLLASQMISELRKDPQLERLSVKDIYNYPTIAKLAAYVEDELSNKKESGKNIEAVPVPNKVSKVTYLSVVSLQALTFLVFFGIGAFTLLIPVDIKEMFPRITYTALIVSSLGGYLMMYAVWTLLSVAVKWTVIGRFKEGLYPLWGFYYFRFWLVKKFVDMVPVNLMSGTPFLNFYFRLMGTKIGRNVYLGSDRIRVFDLVSIGDDSSILKEANILGYSVENGLLRLGKITIGKRCMLGARSMMSENSSIGDGSLLLELSMLPVNETIPAGEVWKGSPAKRTQDEPFYTKPENALLSNAGGFKSFVLAAFRTIALFAVLLFPVVVALPIAIAYYFIDKLYDLGTVLLVSIPLSACYIVLFYFSVSFLKWIVVGRQKPADIPLHSIKYIRKWFIDSLVGMTLQFFRSVYATLYAPMWLRTMGSKIGKKAEVSTVNQITTDLLEVGRESFLADSVSIGSPIVYKGVMYLRTTSIGSRTFIGNSAVLAPGVTVDDECLIGVLSTAPQNSVLKPNHRNTTWLGSPPIFLPKRQESPSFSSKLTFNPPWYMYLLRGSIEIFKIAMPYAIASCLITLFYVAVYYLREDEGPVMLLTSSTFILFLLSFSSIFFGLFFKWGLVGRYTKNNKPLWSTFVWRNEFINSINECMVYPMFENMTLGTPFAPWYFRLMGSKIGRNVYMETTEITEFDLVEIKDNTVLNFGTTVQTHLFEDRVMKMSKVKIGTDCTVGAMSVVLYDTEMGDKSCLKGLSLLMKGESFPADTKWEGSPSVRI